MTTHQKTLIQKAAYAGAYVAGLTWLALSLRAETPKLDTAEYWKAFAFRHAAGEEFERSLTDQQRQTRDAMNKAAQQVQAARAKLAAACGKDAQLDETGTEPVCKQKTK
jgi:hypothetical protein